VTDADEHGEDGHLIEDAQIRSSQVEKRLRKYDGLKKEIKSPQVYGFNKPQLTLVSWGSSYGAVRETVDLLTGNNRKVNMMHFTELWPFPSEEVASVLNGESKIFVVEGNATGQLARLIRAETGIKIDGTILKYDGRPFTAAYIIEKLKKEKVIA